MTVLAEANDFAAFLVLSMCETYGAPDLGCNPLAYELERLLGELCRVREDDAGPWPPDAIGEDDLSLCLHWSPYHSITDDQGNKIDFPTTPEDLWSMWEREKTGPFRPVRGQVINLADRRPQT